MHNLVAVLIPTKNEVENISGLVSLVLSSTDALVLVIDGKSVDGTVEAVRNHDSFGRRLFLHHQTSFGGLGGAYLEGYEKALAMGVNRVVQMDADGSHDPTLIQGLLAEEADLVIGSRWVTGGRTEGWPLGRNLLSRVANASTRVLLKIPVRDCTSGFRAMRANLVRTLLDSPTKSPAGFAFQVRNTLDAYSAGASIKEVPILFRQRLEGKSKLGIANVIGSALWLLGAAMRSDKPG